MYATTPDLAQVQVWSEWSNYSLSTLANSSLTYEGLFVSISGDLYVYSNVGYPRVDKWPLGSTVSTAVMNVSSACTSLFIDPVDTLYCSMTSSHKVMKTSLRNGVSISMGAAGTGSIGAGPNMLHFPKGIFVSVSFDLYVADCYNNRVQMFSPGQLNGTTVAGNGSVGAVTLNCPWGVILDASNQLYVSDYNQNRILRSGPDGLQCIFGCQANAGSSPDRLSSPRAISFDRYGNILVVDWANQRIQKLLLKDNSCSRSSHRSMSSAMIGCFLSANISLGLTSDRHSGPRKYGGSLNNELRIST